MIIIQQNQEVQLSRDASCQLKSCQLPRNSTETTCTASLEQIEVMKMEGYSGTMCNKHVHSTVTRSSRFHCPIGVINKPTMILGLYDTRCYFNVRSKADMSRLNLPTKNCKTKKLKSKSRYVRSNSKSLENHVAHLIHKF